MADQPDRWTLCRGQMKRALGICAVLVAFCAPQGQLMSASAASHGTCSYCGTGTVTPDPGGIDVSEGGGGNTLDPGGTPTTPGGINGPNYEYDYTPACGQNRTLSPADGFVDTFDCPAAHLCPDPSQVKMYVARRTVDGATRDPWTFTGSVCLGPQQLLTYDPAAAAA